MISNLGCTRSIPRTERVPDIVELAGVLQSQVGGPAAIGFHQLDIDFRHELAASHESGGRSGTHDGLLSHVSSHLAGSGLYAVTTTAGDSCPAGIPQTT